MHRRIKSRDGPDLSPCARWNPNRNSPVINPSQSGNPTAFYKNNTMKTCPKCGQTAEDQFDSCWRCSTSLTEVEPEADAQKSYEPKQKKTACFEIIRGGLFSTWNELCEEAAQFVTNVGPADLISISHSEDKNDAVIVVWYWKESPL